MWAGGVLEAKEEKVKGAFRRRHSVVRATL